jgi:hypothetical protein
VSVALRGPLAIALSVPVVAVAADPAAAPGAGEVAAQPASPDGSGWSAGGACLAGVCTGEPLRDPTAWARDGATWAIEVVPEGLVDLTVVLDPAAERVVVVAAVLKGRAACERARDDLTAIVGRAPLETRRDWWTWKTGHSLRIHPTLVPRRFPDTVLVEACVVDRVDPRFDEGRGVWTPEPD